MSAFIVAPAARDDLDAIWDYYGLELQNTDAADRVTGELFDAMRLLSKSPHIGHFRSDLSQEPLRFWHVRSYLIIYRAEVAPIQIVRVLHAAQDVETILQER